MNLGTVDGCHAMIWDTDITKGHGQIFIFAAPASKCPLHLAHHSLNGHLIIADNLAIREGSTIIIPRPR